MITFRNCAKVAALGTLFHLLVVSSHAQTNVVVTNPADIAKAIGLQTPFALTVGCFNNLGPNNDCSGSAHVPSGVR